MKKINLLGIAAIALAMVIIAACPGAGPGGIETTEDFSITGTFKSGEKTSYFKAQKSDGSRAVSRAVGQTQTQPLSGTLDDGDITMRLKGFYDEESGAFTLSAVSSLIKYSISGNSGGATASVATRANTENPNDPPVFKTPEFFPVNTTVSGAEVDANIARGKVTQPVAGFDQAELWGVWYDSRDPNVKYIVGDWGISMSMKAGDTWTEMANFGFAEIKPNGNAFDIVADFTTIEWKPPRRQEDFPAVLKERGYDPVVMGSLPIVHNGFSIFPNNGGNYEYHETRGSIYINTSNGRYGINILYDLGRETLIDGQSKFSFESPCTICGYCKAGAGWNQCEDRRGMVAAGGKEGRPFVVRIIDEDEELVWPYAGSVNYFATVEEALAAAETQLKEYDENAAFDPPGEYSTEVIALSVDREIYYNAHATEDELFSEDPEERRAAELAYEAYTEERLAHYYPDTYGTLNNMIIVDGIKYWDLLNAWFQEYAEEPFTAETRYIKWNVSLANGRLTAKPYYSGPHNNEFWLQDTAFTKETFTEASGLTTLPQPADEYYDSSVTTMTR